MTTMAVTTARLNVTGVLHMSHFLSVDFGNHPCMSVQDIQVLKLQQVVNKQKHCYRVPVVLTSITVNP
jgi:hypothetical protein